MCGIAGFINLNKIYSLNENKSTINLMIHTLKHRGPDNNGYWISENDNLFLGHTRLSIIDLSDRANQPMHSMCGRYTIVFNGEIYNYLELKDNYLLDNKNSLRTSSDTEIILELISKFGVKKAFTLATGMFAAAIWDAHLKKLYLVRDRIGEKPIYYYYDKLKFIFASELKAILKYPNFNKKVNINNLVDYFRFGYFPTPGTIFESLFKLEPGKILEFSLFDQKFTLDSYWNYSEINSKFKKIEFNGNLKNTITIFESKLIKSIDKQRLSDVPVGAFLSGGIDSSLIVSILNDISNSKVKTFTIGFDDSRLNEAKYASKISRYLGTEHHELILNDNDLLDTIPKLPLIFDEPFSDSSQIPNLLVSELAKKTVTVALSGDGGDELFGGYSRYVWSNKIKNLNYILKFILSNTIASFDQLTIESIYNKFKFLLPKEYQFKMPGDKLTKLESIMNLKSIDDIYTRLVSIWPNPENIFMNPHKDNYNSNKYNSIKNQNNMMTRDINTYLPDDLLTKVDRTSMSVSLETRAPFLDHELVEFSSILPLKMKIYKDKQKILPKKLLEKYLPIHLFNRPKMGFEVPIDDWLRGPLKEMCYENINSFKKNSIIEVNKILIDQKMSQHMERKNNWHYQLWNIMVFQSWCEEYL